MANFGYSIAVTCNGKEEISLTTANKEYSNVLDVTFQKRHMPTTNNRGNSIHCQFVIRGAINKETKAELLKIAEWALDENRDTMYRELSIKVSEDTNEVGETGKHYRNYGFTNTYIIDYDEKFDSTSPEDHGEYILVIGQKSEKSEQNINI